MYNIKAVSKILDMPAVTIRSWETRYHAVTPERTDSGHRVYTEEHLNDLKWIKRQVQGKGMNVSQAVKLLKARKEEEQDTASAGSGSLDYSVQIDDLFEAVMQLNVERCEFLFDLYFSQFHYRTVFFSIIVPLMYKVGTAWERGELHVVKEHMISNLIQQRAMRFFGLFDTSPNLPRVMAFCPQGEHHQVGLMLFTLALREKHCPVYYIGADTPLDGLGGLIKELGVEVVAMSTSREEDSPLIKKYIETLTAENPQLKFIVGGLGVKESSRSSTRWDIASDDKQWLHKLPDIIG